MKRIRFREVKKAMIDDCIAAGGEVPKETIRDYRSCKNRFELIDCLCSQGFNEGEANEFILDFVLRE